MRFLQVIVLLAGCLLNSLFTNAQIPGNVADLFAKLKTADDSVKYMLYGQIGFYHMQQDRFDSALYYANLSLSMAEKLGSQRMIGNANNNLGSVYRIYSEYNKALDYFSKAVAIYDKNGLYREASRTAANIAGIYGEQEQYTSAAALFHQSNTAARKVQDTLTLVNNYASLANTYSYLSAFDRSRTYLDSGRVLYTAFATNHPVKQNSDDAMSLQTIFTGRFLNKITALQLSNEKKYDSSIVLYELLLASFNQERGVKNKVDILLGLAENYVELKRYQVALVRTDTALALLRMDSIPVSYKNVYKLRSIIFEKLGRLEEAYFSHKQYKAVNDSIVNAANFKTLASLQAKYETEKKDIRIAALTKEKKAQRIVIILTVAAIGIALVMLWGMYRSRKLQGKLYRQREELLVKEKEIETEKLRTRMTELEQMALRAQMNPHFIFNSLNTVQHFVMNKDVEGVNKYLSIFAHLVRQTLNNSGREVIALDDEVKYLDTYLSLEKMKSDDRFSYAIEVGDSIDQSATFIPGMILQPFVENSIRHGVAYRQNNDGHIRILISKNGQLSCLIEDNGVGRKKAGELKPAAAGFESKGMDITMKRIETINKIYGADIKVQVEDIAGPAGAVEGTRVEVHFPADME